ncbi:hypothetical protein B0920_22040 [Massilia sp. KIM]|uniref:PepSY-associated TM helix domain-containing protein n=1 Tax=Massilia sp. KIM TaxID=1955422 RepID=UPI00098FDA93|nr:PepSY-associated TM helix domain-containing protein [Massilia sp. KIM]OON59955.1 hypothetical protein B0920_22040 [Massilia sp. KIM]
MRAYAVLFHRYVGLVLAGFLLVAGLTGALLAWQHELDALLNPGLYRAPAAQGAAPAPPLDPLVLRERVQAAYPQAAVNYVPLRPVAAGESVRFYLEEAQGGPALAVDEVFVDPSSGRVLGARKWGDISQGLVNLMPFLYRLHYSLALDVIGTWAFGIVALLWTLDCFVGAWLTMPPAARGAAPRKSWWRRWAPAWKLRWQSGPHKLNVDLHRAGGLWPWALLLVLAWSSVAFNLHDPVYRPVMRALFGMQPDPRLALPALDRPLAAPPLGWEGVHAAARRHLQAEAGRRQVAIVAEDRLSWDSGKAYARLVARTGRDLDGRFAQSSVYVDGRTGALLGVWFPTGEAAGDTITTWITTLHMAAIWGRPFQALMSVIGVAVAMLSVTGVLIWLRKRRARRAARPAAVGPLAGASAPLTPP